VYGDRIDYLASIYLGSAVLWWKILDVNPEINNPFNIAPGTVLRIPRS
jgi:nucleoid-associated protein YgaU